MERDFRYIRDKYGDAGAREKFEKICTELFQAKYKDCYPIRTNQGDGGIDIYVGNLKDEIRVFQCKYFIDGIGDSQKAQIRNSFMKASESKKFTMKKWVLCIPCDMDLNEQDWWDEWRKEKKEECSVKIKLYNGSKLLSELHKQKLFDKHFNTIQIDKDFFGINKEKEKKQSISEDFRPIISELKNNDFHYSNVETIAHIDYLLEKYDEDLFFIERNSHIVGLLNQFAQIIALHTYDGKLRATEELEKEIMRYRKEIIKEYRRIIE